MAAWLQLCSQSLRLHGMAALGKAPLLPARLWARWVPSKHSKPITRLEITFPNPKHLSQANASGSPWALHPKGCFIQVAQQRCWC